MTRNEQKEARKIQIIQATLDLFVERGYYGTMSEQENRQMTGSYRHEIQLLTGKTIDVAFLPLDPRQEEYYAEGMRYFLEKIDVKAVYPMHYWGEPDIVDRFLSEYPEYQNIVKDTEHTRKK